MQILDKYFKLAENKTSVRTEVIAGITSFLTAAYIIFVNPAILSKTGMDAGSVFVATCLVAAIGSILMGLYANYPVVIAPLMGSNAYFAYTVVIKIGYPWQIALTAVFLSGILFLILSLSRFRERIINAIPHSIKMSLGAGIGLFLTIIALHNANIIVADPNTLVTLNHFKEAPPILCLIGFCLIVAMDYHRVPGAILWGILLVSAMGIAFDVTPYHGIFAKPPSMAPTFLALDLRHIFEMSFIITMGTFFFVAFFDSTGTLIAIAERLGLVEASGKIRGLPRALQADSASTIIGALLGTSTAGAYVESAAGIRSGGRTGLTAVVVGLLFLASLLFSPLASSIPNYAVSAGLLFVGCIMCESLKSIVWSDITESAPAVITALTMPLTYSITNGVCFGFISYVVIKIITGKIKYLSTLTVGLAVVSFFYLLTI